MTDDERATMADVDHRPPTGEALTGLWRRGPVASADGGEVGDGGAGDGSPDAASDD